MQFIVPTVVLLLIMMVLGVTLSQGFLQSADYLGEALETGTDVEKDYLRTMVSTVSSTATGVKLLVVGLENTGQSRLTDFEEWDVFIEYHDEDSAFHSSRLPYSDDGISSNHWRESGIFFNDADEVFEPGILNAGETIKLEMLLDPLPAWNTTARVHISTPNGVLDSMECSITPGDFALTPHTETVDINGNSYCMLKESDPGDGAGTTLTSTMIGQNVTGRWLLYDEINVLKTARHVYSLENIQEIPAFEWTFYYRAFATDGWSESPYISVDILIRGADGTLRETIASNVAAGSITVYDTWQTVSVNYNFPGYTVAADTDYLEVDFYANAGGTGSSEAVNYIKLDIDDASISPENQTSIR